VGAHRVKAQIWWFSSPICVSTSNATSPLFASTRPPTPGVSPTPTPLPTPTPTTVVPVPTPTPTAPSTLTAQITVSTLSAADYTSSIMAVYNQAYGMSIGVHDGASYKSGCTVTSAASRRSATIVFTVILPTTLRQSASAAATALTPTVFAASLSTAAASAGVGKWWVASADQLAVGAVTTTWGSSSSSASNTGIYVGVAVGGTACVLLLGIGLWLGWWRKQGAVGGIQIHDTEKECRGLAQQQEVSDAEQTTPRRMCT